MIRQIELGLQRRLLHLKPGNYSPLLAGGGLLKRFKHFGYSSVGFKPVARLASSPIFQSPMIIPNRAYISIPSSSNTPEGDAGEAPKEPPKSLKERLSQFFRQYGKLGIAVYFSISGVTFGSIYLALRSGVDVPGILMKLGIEEREWMKNAGTAALAYAIYKLLLPLRLAAVVWLTRSIARRFGNKFLTKGK